MRHISGYSDQKGRRLTACEGNESPKGERSYCDGLTWDRMAIKGQHLVLGFWHFRYEIANALRSLVGISIPAHGRVGAIEIR